MIKAIIFDYDGVIVDSFPSVFSVYQKICHHFKVEAPETIEEFRKIYGYNYIECIKNLGIDHGNLEGVRALYKNEIIKIDHSVFPGVPELLESLSEQFRLYLVSASHSDEVMSKLEKHDLKKYFTFIYCGGDNSTKKSEMTADLFSKFGYNPNEVIFIGDRAIDYESAKKVGIDDKNIIMAAYGWGLNKNEIGRPEIAESPADILKIIKSK